MKIKLMVRTAKKIKSTDDDSQKGLTCRIYMPRCYAGLGPSRPYRIPSARRLDKMVSPRSFYISVCDNNFPSLVASLFSW